MTEVLKPTPAQVAAQENLVERQNALIAILPFFIDHLLIATGGNKELVRSLLRDVTNIACFVGALAVATRRKQAAVHNTVHPELHPDTMFPRQESILFGTDGAQPIIDAIKLIEERANLVANGQSPLQRSDDLSV